MPEIFLELLHHRVLNLSTGSGQHLAPCTTGPSPAAQTVLTSPHTPADTSDDDDDDDADLDELTALVFTLIDSLPILPPHILEDWLPRTAELLPVVEPWGRRQRCKERFWGVLSGGEMDVDRSLICIAWWGSRGGREMVSFAGGAGGGGGDGKGLGEGEIMMSGALGVGGGGSKL